MPIKTKYEEQLRDFAGKGRIILASNEADEVSREIDFQHQKEQEPHIHGAFTAYLIEGLDGEASDEDGIITLDGLRTYVDNRLAGIGKQRLKYSITDASELSQIIIALAPSKYIENIENKIKDAKQFYDNFISYQDPSSLFHAADIISDVLKINAENKISLDLKIKISDALTKYNNTSIDWIYNNYMDVSPKIPEIFRKIEKLAYYLDFNRIKTLDRGDKTLLIALYKVSTGMIDKDLFVRICKPFADESRVISGDVFRK